MLFVLLKAFSRSKKKEGMNNKKNFEIVEDWSRPTYWCAISSKEIGSLYPGSDASF